MQKRNDEKNDRAKCQADGQAENISESITKQFPDHQVIANVAGVLSVAIGLQPLKFFPIPGLVESKLPNYVQFGVKR